jgi:lipid-binding SYLF domain-containing protein
MFQGLFLGVSLEASGVVARPDLNRAYYGTDILPAELLSGSFPRPKGAEPLYRALAEVMLGVEAQHPDSYSYGGGAVSPYR